MTEKAPAVEWEQLPNDTWRGIPARMPTITIFANRNSTPEDRARLEQEAHDWIAAKQRSIALGKWIPERGVFQ